MKPITPADFLTMQEEELLTQLRQELFFEGVWAGFADHRKIRFLKHLISESAKGGLDYQIAEYLCSSYESLPSVTDDKGHNLLHFTIIYEKEDFGAFLIKRYPKLLEQRDERGRNSLHWIAACNSPLVNHLDLSAAPLLSGIDRDGMTPFHIAAKEENHEMIEKFISLLERDPKHKYRSEVAAIRRGIEEGKKPPHSNPSEPVVAASKLPQNTRS